MYCRIWKKGSFMKKENHALQIVYIILLSVQVPFNLFYLWLGLTQMEKMTAVFLYFGIAALFFGAVGILGIVNVVKSFRAYRRGDLEYCLKAMLKLKYGMVPFFIVNLLGMTMIFLLALVASRGTIILMFPAVAFFIGLGVLCTWLAMLPGSFYAFQVARFAEKEGKTTRGRMILHMILQCLFLVDVLDAAYLSVKHWKRGRVGAILIGLLYGIVIIGCVAAVMALSGK